MIKHNITCTTSIVSDPPCEGEFIETKIERIVNNNEAITDGAPLIYQERDEGIAEGYDIRTDRWDVAVEAMDVASKSKLAKRAENKKNKDDEIKSIDGTETGSNPVTPKA